MAKRTKPAVKPKPRVKVVKQPKETPEPPKFYVRVRTDDYQRITRHRKYDRWDNDDVEHHVTIDGLVITDERSEWDFIVDRTGVEYYVVSCAYRTGDSFHHETGVLAKVGIFKTYTDAKRVQDWIGENPKADNVRVTLPDGTVFEHYAEWTGYFEHLEDVRIDTLWLDKKEE